MPWFPPPDPQAVAQRRKLEQALDRAVPDWREFNRDPWWHAWLAMTHLYSEASRGWHLDAAAARGDADSVIGFYQDFLRTHPRRAPPPAGPALDGKTIYTRDDILRLHAQHRKGAYAGREIEWMRIEHDIIRAARENRIIGGIPLDRSRSGDSR